MGHQEATIDDATDLRRQISVRMTVLARLMRSDFDRHVGDVGITRSQWALIVTVAKFPGSTQRHIAELLNMSEVSAGRQIDRMVAEGLLERREREDDRRARAVFLTDNARPLLEAMSALAHRREEQAFRGMSEEQLGDLCKLLDLVFQNMNPGGANPFFS